MNKAYKDRRLASRGERSRLIAALLERRRARILSSGKARDKAALRREEDRERRQCEETCGTVRMECQNRSMQSLEFCKKVLPTSGRRRHEGLRACNERRRLADNVCRSEQQRCQQGC